MTIVPSLIRLVWPARKPSVAYASNIGDSGGGPVSRIWKKWSMTQRLSKPASSAVTAIRDITDPISSVVTGQEKLPIPIPIFIACAPNSVAGKLVSRVTNLS